MDKLEILKKIEAYRNGPKDYQEGRKLIKIIPGAETIYRQLTEMETYESRIRIYSVLNEVVASIKQDLPEGTIIEADPVIVEKETVMEKRRRGRPKGPKKISPEAVIIQEWLDGPQDYEKGLQLGLNLLKKKIGSVRTYARLMKGDSSLNRMKLQHLLSSALKRL